MNNLTGVMNLSEKLSKYISNVEKPQEILVEAAKEYVRDARKLPKPMSKITKSGYTHLVHDIDYRRTQNNEVEVGSRTKYYIRFVELGTRKMSGTYFMRNLYNSNKEKYIKIMLNALER